VLMPYSTWKYLVGKVRHIIGAISNLEIQGVWPLGVAVHWCA
jgi:hypothetical protein